MPAVTTTQAPVVDVLPATASTTPLIGLLGLIALGGALSLRMIEKRAR
jgi:MYXO-CTERM domain-containing protein